MIKCSFCGYEFDEKESQKACQSCPFSRGCGKYKCPNCGFEIVNKSRLSRFFNRRRKRKKGNK